LFATIVIILILSLALAVRTVLKRREDPIDKE